jgi:hypothetical protein
MISPSLLAFMVSAKKSAVIYPMYVINHISCAVKILYFRAGIAAQVVKCLPTKCVAPLPQKNSIFF